jgi:hypothetical protein
MKRALPAPILAPGAVERLTALVGALPSLRALGSHPFDVGVVVSAHKRATDDLDQIELCAANHGPAQVLLTRITACEFTAYAYTREVRSGRPPRDVAALAAAFDLGGARLGLDLPHRLAVGSWLVLGVAS